MKKITEDITQASMTIRWICLKDSLQYRMVWHIIHM